MSALGSLVVKLALEYAEYTQGLNKSDQEALKFAQNAQKHFDKASAATSDFMSGLVAKAAGAVVAVVGVSAVIDKLTHSIDTLAKLDDMAQKTGSSVENLSRLQKVASAFGKDFSQVDGILVKLSKGMATADDDTNKVNKALKALGVSSKDAAGKLRDPSEVLVDAAKNLQGFEDGANKSALAIDLLGKQGADSLPYLNDLAENVDKFTGASTAAAKEASDFQDNMGRLKVRSEELYTAVASALLPSMIDLAGAFLDVSTKGDGMADPAVREWADDLAVGLARVADVAVMLGRVFGAVGGSVKAVAADIEFMGAVSANASAVGAAIKLARGESPLDNLRAAAEKRNKILEDANKKYEDLWNKPANQFEQAILRRQAAHLSAVKDMNDFGDGTAGGPSGKKPLTYTTGNPKAAAAEAASEYDKLNKSLQARIALTEKEIELGRPLTESEKEIAKLVRARAEGTVKLTDAEMVKLEQGIKTLSLNEQVLHSRELIRKATDEQAAAAAKEVAAGYEAIDKLQEEIDTYGMLPSAITAVHIAELERYKSKLENQPEMDMGLAKEIANTNELLEVNKKLASLQGSKEALEANKKNTEESSAAWKKSYDEVGGYIGDALQRGFENSGQLIKSFIQSIKSAFARLVLNPIIQPISAGYASFMNPNAPQAAGMAPGGPDSASSAVGVAQMASSVYKAISGGFEGISTSVADAVQTGMNAAGMSSNLLSNGPVAQFAGQAASYAGGAYAGHAIGNMISGDYSVGNHGQAVVNIGTAIGTAIAGPIGGAVGGAIGGFVNRLFGMKEKEVTTAGIRGTVGPAGVTGDSFSTWHQDAGWFRSDKNGTDSTALSADISTQFAAGLKSIKDASTGFAAMLGLSADAIESYSKDFNIVLTKDAAANEKAITEFFTGIGDEIAGQLVPHLEDFSKAGESASATLQRLAGDFQATDQVARLLSSSAAEMFGAIGMESAAARSRLVELSGGAPALGAKAAAYAGAFLTEEEKIAPVLKAVAEAMGELGLASVRTKVDFKAQVNSMIEGGALATEAGAKLFAQLMDLAPVFAQAADYTEALTQATEEKTAAEKAAFDALAVSRSQEQHGLDIALMAAMGDAEGALATTRKDALDALLSDQARLTQQQIWASEAANDAMAAAQAQTKEQHSLEIQLMTAMGDAEGALAATREDALAALLSDRARVTQAAIYAAEDANAAIAKAQETAKSQVDAAAAQAAAFQSTLGAMGNGLIDTMNRSMDAAKALRAFNESLKLGNLSSLSKGAQYDLAKSQYLNAGVLDKQAAATTFLQASQANGGSKLDFARDFAMVMAGNSDAASANYDIPASAVEMFRQMQAADGSHAGGLKYVPFDGYKAILHKGERVQTAAEVRNGDNGTKEEIKQMRIELKAALEAIALNTSGVNRTLKGAVIDGVLQTATVAA